MLVLKQKVFEMLFFEMLFSGKYSVVTKYLVPCFVPGLGDVRDPTWCPFGGVGVPFEL